MPNFVRDDAMNVRARIILEISGAPKELVEKAMKNVQLQIKGQDDLEIEEEKIGEVTGEELGFSTFANYTLLFRDLDSCTRFCFDYHPSSVEIIDPAEIKFTVLDLTTFYNDLLGNLHDVDKVVRTIGAQNRILNANIVGLIRNLILISLHGKKKTADELAKIIGVGASELPAVLDDFVNEGVLLKEGEHYTLKDGRS